MPITARPTALHAGWDRLAAHYHLDPPTADAVFDLLVTAHSAPGRHYHTLDHLADMFRTVGRLTELGDDPSVLHLAVWFHDAVYDPRARDNEGRSGELAVAVLGPAGVPGADLDRVARLIRATAHFAATPPAGDHETAILLDADLAVLGAEPDVYQRYADGIRREYAWAPEADYRAGRARVLDHFLARPRLFRTDLLHRERDDQARANLWAELAELNAHR